LDVKYLKFPLLFIKIVRLEKPPLPPPVCQIIIATSSSPSLLKSAIVYRLLSSLRYAPQRYISGGRSLSIVPSGSICGPYTAISPPLREKNSFPSESRYSGILALMGRNKKNDYLLAGKIWCTCGHRRAGEGPQHGKHLYYRCTDRVYCFPLPRECYEKGINARISDAAIWNRLKMILSSPKLLLEQVERWNSSRTIIKGSQVLTANIENTEAEIKKLQIQDDRLAILYSEGKIELNKFDEYVKPIRDRIVEYKKQISQVNLEKRPESDILLPSKEEIVKFAKVAHKYTENVSFATKQLIIRKAVNVITASRESLQVYGLINIKELQHVVFCTEYRNCRSAKCWEKHLI